MMLSDFDLKSLIKYVPSSERNLKRLGFLCNKAGGTRIAVFGKYNHGKSTLLNALIGDDIFKAADKRETISVSEYCHNGITWIDTPGLDADVKGKDDKLAKEAAFEMADFIFLVHNVKSGELDKYEKNLFNYLMRQDQNYKNKLYLILSQIDQLESQDLAQVIANIHQQIPELTIMPVSATRYQKGVKASQDKFIESSGLLALNTLISELDIELVSLRKKEIKRLKNKAIIDLQEQLTMGKNTLVSINHNRAQFEQSFVNSITELFEHTQTQVRSI